MKGSSLLRLAAAANAAKIDFAPSPLVLIPTETGTTAFYAGGYVACGIAVEDRIEATGPVAVSAPDFQALASVFSGVESRLHDAATALTVSSGKRHSTLRHVESHADVGQYQQLLDHQANVVVDLATFTAEAVLAEACAAKSMASPILAGARLVGAKNVVGLQATNGQTIIFETTIPSRALSDEKIDVVPPVKDLLLALRIMRGDELRIGRIGNALVLQTDDAVMRIPLMAGAFPKVSQARASIVDAQQVTVLTAILRDLVAAAKLYDTVVLNVEGDGQTIRFSTQELEAGQYVDEMEGMAVGSWKLNVDDIDILLRASDGVDAFTMDLAHTMAATRIGSRSIHMLLRS